MAAKPTNYNEIYDNIYKDLGQFLVKLRALNSDLEISNWGTISHDSRFRELGKLIEDCSKKSLKLRDTDADVPLKKMIENLLAQWSTLENISYTSPTPSRVYQESFKQRCKDLETKRVVVNIRMAFLARISALSEKATSSATPKATSTVVLAADNCSSPPASSFPLLLSNKHDERKDRKDRKELVETPTNIHIPGHIYEELVECTQKLSAFLEEINKLLSTLPWDKECDKNKKEALERLRGIKTAFNNMPSLFFDHNLTKLNGWVEPIDFPLEQTGIILRFRALQKGLKSLCQDPSDARVDEIVRDSIRLTELNKTGQFCEALDESRAAVIVISLGSAGEEVQQRCPKFSKDLAQNSSVDVLNVDPGFSQDAVVDPLSSGRLSVRRYAGKLTTSSPDFRELMDHFKARIDDILTHTSQNVVLFCNESPFLCEIFREIGIKHHDKIGNRLSIVGNSGCHGQPVFVFAKALFERGSEDLLASTMGAWEKILQGKYRPASAGVSAGFSYAGEPGTDWSGLSYEEIRRRTREHNSAENLEIWREEFATLGQLYPNIESIPAKGVFPTPTSTLRKKP